MKAKIFLVLMSLISGTAFAAPAPDTSAFHKRYGSIFTRTRVKWHKASPSEMTGVFTGIITNNYETKITESALLVIVPNQSSAAGMPKLLVHMERSKNLGAYNNVTPAMVAEAIALAKNSRDFVNPNGSIHLNWDESSTRTDFATTAALIEGKAVVSISLYDSAGRPSKAMFTRVKEITAADLTATNSMANLLQKEYILESFSYTREYAVHPDYAVKSDLNDVSQRLIDNGVAIEGAILYAPVKGYFADASISSNSVKVVIGKNPKAFSFSLKVKSAHPVRIATTCDANERTLSDLKRGPKAALCMER